MDIDSALRAEISSYGRNEWVGVFAGQQMTWYAKPLTPADIEYVTRFQPDFMQNPRPSGMIDAIIRKAELEDGTKVFSTRGKYHPVLSRLKNDKVGEIFGALFADQFTEETDETFEARVGN